VREKEERKRDRREHTAICIITTEFASWYHREGCRENKVEGGYGLEVG
jgi:hypothetical protein